MASMLQCQCILSGCCQAITNAHPVAPSIIVWSPLGTCGVPRPPATTLRVPLGALVFPCNKQQALVLVYGCPSFLMYSCAELSFPPNFKICSGKD